MILQMALKLPENVKHVKGVFDELSDDNLLMKCLPGETSNQKEAFNRTKWNRIPISSLKWVFSMQPFISTSITGLPFSLMIKWVRN